MSRESEIPDYYDKKLEVKDPAYEDELIKIKRKSFLNYIEAVIRISNKMSKE